MPLRRQSSDILYPFHPGAEAHRALVAGIVDAFFILRPPGTAGPWGSSSSSESSDWPSAAPYSAALCSVEVTATQAIYLFYARAPEYWQALTFTATRGQGLARVNAAENPLCMLIMDTDRLPDTVGTYAGLWAELEPARLVFQLDELRSIRLVNEYRDHDTRTRDAAIAANPDRTVTLLDFDGGVLKLQDGHNCALSYDEDTGTLTLTAGPGMGTGLPDDYPWDSAGLDIFTGVKSVNGLNVDGNLELRFGASVVPEYTAAALEMRIKDES